MCGRLRRRSAVVVLRLRVTRLFAIFQVLAVALIVAGFAVWLGLAGGLIAGGVGLLAVATAAELLSVEDAEPEPPGAE